MVHGSRTSHHRPWRHLLLHGLNYFLNPLHIDHLKRLNGAIILSANNGDSADRASQLLTLQAYGNWVGPTFSPALE